MAEATITDTEIMQELEQIGNALESAGVVSNRLEALRYKIVCRERGRHEWYMRGPGDMYCRQCGKTAATAQSNNAFGGWILQPCKNHQGYC